MDFPVTYFVLIDLLFAHISCNQCTNESKSNADISRKLCPLMNLLNNMTCYNKT